MRRTVAVYRRELAAYMDSPVAWVTTVLFVLVLHGVFFFKGYPLGARQVPAFWEGRTASLQALFAWLPLLFVLLAPALTMGAWAEERRSGTEELLLTQPLRARDCVLGKFLAAWSITAILSAVCVLPLALVVSRLGPLDWGTVWGGLLGAFFLSAGCLAIGLFFSAVSQEQLLSFLLSVAVLLILWSASLFVDVLPPVLAEVAWYASPSVHYVDTVTRGMLDARDVLYHGLLVLLGLYLTVAVVEGRRWR